jgi:hypothetical protein
MSDELKLDYVDYTSIAFPSDNLTVGKLRKLYPDLFDVEGAGHREFFSANAWGKHSRPEEEWLAAMLSGERYLARHAFEVAFGNTWTCLTQLGDTRDESAVELGKYYIHFGLASGPQHADQLVRAFEAQAASQGKPPEGPVPPSQPSLGR